MIDAALDRLKQPTSVDERLEVLRAAVEYWHGSVGPADGEDSDTIAPWRLPRVLAWWFGWAGRRPEILSGQNQLCSLRPEPQRYGLREVDGLLEFYVENQQCYAWATEPEGDDPPVYGRYETSQPWVREEVSLSEHLILACLFEAVMCHAPYRAMHAALEPARFEAIARVIEPIAIGPWHWCGPTRFYARNGAFMFAMPNGGDLRTVCVGARSQAPLAFLQPMLDNTWDSCAI